MGGPEVGATPVGRRRICRFWIYTFGRLLLSLHLGSIAVAVAFTILKVGPCQAVQEVKSRLHG